MKPMATFFSVPVLSEPSVQKASNGASFISFAVKSNINDIRNTSPAARIRCFEENPNYERIQRMKIRKGSVVNMTCELRMVRTPAVKDRQIANALYALLKSSNPRDKALASFVSDDAKLKALFVKETSYFEVTSIDYARTSGYEKAQKRDEESTRPMTPPEKPLTMEGF